MQYIIRMETTSTVQSPLPPAPPHKEHWLLGGSYYLLQNPIHYLQENRKSMDGIYLITSPIRKAIVVDTPEYVKHVLQDNNKNYTKSLAYKKLLTRLLGKGLLTSEGDFWRKQRRLAQPAFHRDKLALLADDMVKCTEAIITELEAVAGQEVNLAKYMMTVTLDVVAKSMFGSDVSGFVQIVGDEIDYANEQAMKRIKNPLKLPPWVPTPDNIKEQRSLDNLDRIINGIIETRRRSDKKHDDLLQMLMDVEDVDTGEKMSDRQLRDESMTIFLAGHETTALALSWLWYLLEKNPDKAEKLYTEVDTVLQGRIPQLNDLKDLTYIRQVIDETLRLYPSAWAIGRNAKEDDEIGGYRIPADYNVLIPIYIIHRDPSVWENPDDFIPERFAKENQKELHKYAYFPFGGGPRFCIGNNFALMEMQIIVAMLAQRFRFKLQSGKTVEPAQLLTLRPKGGMPMTVIER